jgi:predicted small secreted protein
VAQRAKDQTNSMKNKLLPLLFVSVLWAAFGTGCNTANGVGKDIEKAGNKIQDAAK